jgi:hypothetical protein
MDNTRHRQTDEVQAVVSGWRADLLWDTLSDRVCRCVLEAGLAERTDAGLLRRYEVCAGDTKQDRSPSDAKGVA